MAITVIALDRPSLSRVATLENSLVRMASWDTPQDMQNRRTAGIHAATCPSVSPGPSMAAAPSGWTRYRRGTSLRRASVIF